MVEVDSSLMFERSYLKFAQPDPKYRTMWGPILEKAWAKLKGNYDNVDGGFLENGIRALTGIPVFAYDTAEIID